MKKLPQLEVKKRIVILFFIVLLVFFVFALRLVWIQVVNSDEYQKKALDQRLRQLKVEPKRGIIYDRNGKGLAVSASSETVVGLPMEVENPEEAARKLSRVLSVDYNTLRERLTRKASAVYLERKVSDEIAEKVRRLDLKGITFTEESKRYYPKDNLASHLLGFAGIDSQGLDGLELSYDKYLRGVPGRIETEKDAAGRTIPEGIQEYIAPQNGYNIYLTIDEVIQYLAERELDRAMKEFNISGGTVIVMDPKTGGVLALANRPDYNPNDFAEYPQKHWRNRAISDSFEPGSTFKIITTASALEEGAVNEHDRFVDPGHIIVSGEKISCWKYGGHGAQSFAEVVENSCNPGFVQVGMRLGKEAFYNYITAFGFGEKLGIELPGEARGLVYKYDDIGPVELATISFGQGISVTPIQLVSAVSAVANGGMLLKPRLLAEVRNPEGELVKEFSPEPIRQVVSKKTAERTLKLLERVVANGTGTAAQIEGYRVGGKTGTAKHYGVQVYDSSFIGILPIEDPRLVIMVVLYDVTGYPYYGSQTAAPMFKNIALDALRYLEIPPTTGEEAVRPPARVRVPDLKGRNPFQAVEIVKKQGLEAKLIGEGADVLEQVPLPGAEVEQGTTVLLFTSDKNQLGREYYVAVPDLTGLYREDAANLLAELGLVLISNGEGRAVKQDLEPGIRVPGGTRVAVEFKADG